MDERDDWDRHWTLYGEAAFRNPAQQMRHELVVALLQDDLARDARILDLGSGQGDLLARFRNLRPHAELLGFELSESGVATSRRQVPAGKFHVADIFRPPGELQVYSKWATEAVCSEVLEHVDSPVAFLQACRPYLAAGARLVVTVPGGPMSAFDRHIGHRQHFTPESIRRDLHAAGFAIQQVHLSGFPFFNLYRCLVVARGERLIADVNSGGGRLSRWLARMSMALFRGLFRLNLRDSPFGWQVVAVARKTGDY